MARRDASPRRRRLRSRRCSRWRTGTCGCACCGCHRLQASPNRWSPTGSTARTCRWTLDGSRRTSSSWRAVIHGRTPQSCTSTSAGGRCGSAGTADAARYFLRAAAARDARYPATPGGQDLLYLARHAARRCEGPPCPGAGDRARRDRSASSKPSGGSAGGAGSTSCRRREDAACESGADREPAIGSPESASTAGRGGCSSMISPGQEERDRPLRTAAGAALQPEGGRTGLAQQRLVRGARPEADPVVARR